MTIPDGPDALEDGPATRELDEAFRVADRLAVHGSTCLCPPCAGRLPGLLTELARCLTAREHFRSL
jgi:hypothetical protein